MTADQFLKCFLYFCCLTSAIFKANGFMNSSVCSKRIKRASDSDECSGCCVLPEYPTYGRWEIQNGVKADPGAKVKFSTVLIFSCYPRFKLSTENGILVCLGDKWSGTPPTCLRLCPTLYTSKVTQVTCYDKNNVIIKCNSASDGASASFECADFYEPADRTPSTRYCYNGQWDLAEPQCIPVCGLRRYGVDPLIVNGTTVLRGDYPWVTAIYQKRTSEFEHVCSGSMLTQKLIITAAHCVTNDFGDLLNKTLIQIAVGKYYRKYKDPRDTLAQHSEVTEIIVHSSYRGDNQRFASDIAFLITKDVLVLSPVAQPVCYKGLRNIFLSLKDIGLVTGWGYTTANGNASDELKEVSIPYKESTTCISELPKDWTDQYFTYDKLCAGHYNKSIAVCKGDSGGGLVFRNERDKGRYYIHGLVSVGYKTEDNCNIQLSALYTKVAVHYQWLEQLASRFRYVPPKIENYEDAFYECKKENRKCISMDKKCNGLMDCEDGSDESSDCGKTCTLPDHPENGKWSIRRSIASKPGDKVYLDTFLNISCNPKFILSNKNNILICQENGWSDTIPSCLRLCSPFSNTESTYVTCYDENGTSIKCDSAVDGSKAEFKCALYYEPVERLYGVNFCFNGSWGLTTPQCVPVCGEKQTSAEPLIIGGHITSRGEYPWVAAIYRKNDNNEFMNSCGGTMLTQKIILTVATCVTNYNGKPLDETKIRIAVGKYYNKYDNLLDTTAQYSEIKKIVIHPDYNRLTYSNNIAILVTTKTLLISKVSQPICYRNLPNVRISSGDIGEVSGWGYTLPNSQPSEELKTVSVPYLSKSYCFANLPNEWRNNYYTYDKMCAGYFNNSIALCKGDSGNGLVFKNKRDNRYYIHGLTSIGVASKDGGCDIQSISLYTQVATHYEWLEKVAASYR